MADVVTDVASPIASLNCFRGKRVFLTGHTGFKGSWLALWLHELGAEVFGYALPPYYANSHFERLGLAGTVHHIEGDVRDLDHLRRAMTEAQPEFVFHLAAQALVRKSYSDPIETFSTNVMGTAHVLEVVRQLDSVRALVCVTSDKCYLNKEWDWSYRENDELGGHDPYSASKAAAENTFLAYYHSYLKHRPNLGAATARAGNVIGGGDWSADRLVPDCIRALVAKQPIVLRNPGSTRPWQFVLEPLAGYLVLAAKLAQDPQRFAGSWNFGPQPTGIKTVDEVAKQIIKVWSSGEIKYEIAQNTVQHEAKLLQLAIDKAIGQLGWQPAYAVEKCLAETVSWYRAMHEGADVPALSRTQIKNYANAAALIYGDRA